MKSFGKTKLLLLLTLTLSISACVNEKLNHNENNELTELYKTCQPYKNYIQEQAAKRDMPKEIYVIATIESGCKESVVSLNKNNTGMWQLNNNMINNKRISNNSNADIMKDWRKSTDFALDYIKFNAENYFDNNYELAVISYNAGVHSVKKAIKKNKSTDASIIIQDKSIFKDETVLYFNKYISYSKGFSEIEKNNKI